MATSQVQKLTTGTSLTISRMFSMNSVFKKDINSLVALSKKTGIAVHAKEFVSTVPLEEIIHELKDREAVQLLKSFEASHFLVGSEVNSKVIYGIANNNDQRTKKELINYQPASVRSALN
jgi:hypothetical protein